MFDSRNEWPVLTLGVLAVGAGIAAALIYRERQRQEEQAYGYLPRGRSAAPAYARGVAAGSGERGTYGEFRPAGQSSMRDRDRSDWDSVDEELDETFPASDPPANY